MIIRRRDRAVGVMAAITLTVAAATGCTATIPGRSRASLSAVKMLLTEAEISNVVGNPLGTYGFRPFVGGLEIMPDGFRVDAEATPIRCAGVTETMLRRTYAPEGPIEAARQSYFNLDRHLPVSGADAAAVVLASPETAQKRLAVFARDWQSCDGQTVVKHLNDAPGDDVFAAIRDVVRDGPMLSATVTTQQGAGVRMHYARAAAQRGRIIVEVSLAVNSEQRASGAATARRVASVMLDKASRQ